MAGKSSNPLNIGDKLDEEDILRRLKRVDENGSKVDAIVSSIVDSYCKELDKFINEIYKLVSDKSMDVPDVDIEYMALQLPCLMYFTSDKLEDLGLREDISRGVEKETYNNIMLNTEGTVSSRESAAQMASQKDALITAINSRAYRKIKARIEFATETLGSLKKVMANRISNRELSART